MSEPTPCDVRDGRCQSYAPGHHTHSIHAKQIGLAPWGWRDAVVTSVADRWTTVTYLEHTHPVRLWHHVDLAGELQIGAPVRVHERFWVLGGPFGWLNVVVEGGLGAVPEPANRSAWQGQMTGGVQDVGTGRALALDWVDPAGT